MSNCNKNLPRTRAGSTLYITGLHKHFFSRGFSAPRNKSLQAAMNLCGFQAAAVRKPHRSTCKSHSCRTPGSNQQGSDQHAPCTNRRKGTVKLGTTLCWSNTENLAHCLWGAPVHRPASVKVSGNSAASAYSPQPAPAGWGKNALFKTTFWLKQDKGEKSLMNK